jgi:hypothetical protein
VNGSFGPYNGVIPGGTVAGGTVVFTFDVDACCGGPGSQWQNQGHASNSSMSGSMVAVVTLNGTQYSLYGLWQANKQ